MNAHLFMGLFALFVVVVSLLRLMAEREFPRLTAMKKIWGRSRGLAMHFLSNVALPLVFGIIFLGRGVAGFDHSHPSFATPATGAILSRASSQVRTAEPPLRTLAEGLSLAGTAEGCLGERAVSPGRSDSFPPFEEGLAEFLDLRLP